ncbi:hypothetical protein PSPO01_11879 [Paraphaeosphaeria sporulosa]
MRTFVHTCSAVLSLPASTSTAALPPTDFAGALQHLPHTGTAALLPAADPAATIASPFPHRTPSLDVGGSFHHPIYSRASSAQILGLHSPRPRPPGETPFQL